MTPLETAIMLGHTQTVAVLLPYSRLDFCNNNGDYPVHWAARSLRPDAYQIIELLYAAGADFTVLTRYLQSTVHIAKQAHGPHSRITKRVRQIYRNQQSRSCCIVCSPYLCIAGILLFQLFTGQSV